MKLARRLSLVMLLLILVTILTVTYIPTSAQGRVVTDMDGRKVVLPDRIDRIVTTYNTATQFIFALGAQDHLVSGSSGSSLQKLCSTLNPAIKDQPEVGSKRKGVNVEQVVALQPDLVILYPHNDGPEVARKLEKQGIASVIIKPESHQKIKETTRLLGEVLNLEEKAEEINQEYNQILKLAERTADLSMGERKKVYFANNHLLSTVGEGMLQTSLIELAGGINSAKEAKSGFMQISSEQLINWNPDIIIISQCYRDEIEKLKRMPQYQTITAFKEGEIYQVPSNLEPWDFPSPSSYLMIPWLAEKLYPGKFADIDVSQAVDDFYKKLYGSSFTELGGRL